MLREEIKSIKSGRVELRKFGVTVGAALLILAGLLFWKQRPSFIYVAGGGGLLAALGLLAPILLKPLHKIWMSFAVVMGFVMTRVILTLIYFGLFTPIALLLRLLGKDVLEERWDKSAATYWVRRKREPYDPSSAERMF